MCTEDNVMSNTEKGTLLLDEEYAPIISEDECSEFQPIIKDFMECYAAHENEPVQR